MGSVPTSRKRPHDDSAAAGERDSKRTPWMSSRELAPFLEEGDLVEFNRDIYQHWGVFVKAMPEDDVYYIIHLSGDPSEQAMATIARKCAGDSLGASLKAQSGAAMVQMSNIYHVAGNYQCRVNNSGDADFAPYPRDVVVARAFLELDKKKYNALFTNCEHFATWCRYGTKSSRQSSMVKTVATGLVVGVTTWSAAYATLGAGAYYVASRLGQRIFNSHFRGHVSW